MNESASNSSSKFDFNRWDLIYLIIGIPCAIAILLGIFFFLDGYYYYFGIALVIASIFYSVMYIPVKFNPRFKDKHVTFIKYLIRDIKK